MVHLQVLFNRAIKFFVVHSMLMELSLSLVAQTLLQGYTSCMFSMSYSYSSNILPCVTFSFVIVLVIIFVDNLQVWTACKPNTDDAEQPNHEIDVLAGHENDVNYVQFRSVYHALLLRCLLIELQFSFMLLPKIAVVVLFHQDFLRQTA